ncbi:MAG: hypothetical protein SWN10_04225 [Pseudomonadota bacterium]|nr:hypothetical protein [Pseudomonadota bacterium]
MRKAHLLTGIAAALTITACGSTAPTALPTYPDVSIPALPGAPTDAGSVKSNKLLVAPGVKSNVPSFIQNMFVDNVNTFVTESGSEVIDRQLAQRFIDEIQLKENLSESYDAYEGPVEAKFVIIPTITDYSWSSEYEKAESRKNKDGERVHYPAECDYTGKVKGNLQIRALPSMKQILSLNLTGRESGSKENPPSRKCDEQSMINGAIKGAIADLLVKGNSDYVTLSKYVSSQGMITGAKKAEGDIYFETNLGRLNGAKEEAAVAIYQEIDGELVKIASGEMVDKDNVFNNKSYIKVDEDLVPRIKRGMIVMLSGECTGFGCKWDRTLKDLSN